MAKKQTRRSVSMNWLNYKAVQQSATLRGMTIAGLVEFALGTIGVPVVVHPQQSPALVGANAARRRGTKCAVSPRRSVSINRLNYEAAKQAALVRGVSIAGLLESALGAIGVPVVACPPERAKNGSACRGVQGAPMTEQGNFDGLHRRGLRG